MSDRDNDRRIRLAAFEWLEAQSAIHGEVLPYQRLKQGFVLDGQRVPLLGPQGIFKPKVMPYLPLSITTAPSQPYNDAFSNDVLQYRYRGTDPQHADNKRLRAVIEDRAPLIYFHGIAKGQYVAAWPAYVIGDDPKRLTFAVAVDDLQSSASLFTDSMAVEDDSNARRVYVTAQVKRRLHQQSFRVRVLRAYRQQCALCRLKHDKLLDAAHIIPDSEVGGEPRISNGLALCKIHHAAYDRLFLAITPDYGIIVRGDILEEEDGPMLKHGLQGLHGKRLIIPRRTEWRPDRDALAKRMQQFAEVGS